ncbi:MAG: hypothetical protein E7056_05950 [Lentisphaerae bacterium]|nr:hypothetical protein [Lentisphaerota bacterium]
MKQFICFFSLAAALFGAGCSHNSITYSDGVGFETTLRPDTGNFGVLFRYGKILSVAARENTEVEMVGAGNGSSGDKSTVANAAADGSVKVKIGSQVTDYFVDAIKAGATFDQLEKYLKKD